MLVATVVIKIFLSKKIFFIIADRIATFYITIKKMFLYLFERVDDASV